LKTARQQCAEGLELMAKASFVIATQSIMKQLMADARRDLSGRLPIAEWDTVADWLTEKYDELVQEAVAAGYAVETSV
jgi:hypothetical protein